METFILSIVTLQEEECKFKVSSKTPFWRLLDSFMLRQELNRYQWYQLVLKNFRNGNFMVFTENSLRSSLADLDLQDGDKLIQL